MLLLRSTSSIQGCNEMWDGHDIKCTLRITSLSCELGSWLPFSTSVKGLEVRGHVGLENCPLLIIYEDQTTFRGRGIFLINHECLVRTKLISKKIKEPSSNLVVRRTSKYKVVLNFRL